MIRRCLERDPDERWQSPATSNGSWSRLRRPPGGFARFAIRFAVLFQPGRSRSPLSPRLLSWSSRFSGFPGVLASAVDPHEHLLPEKSRALSLAVSPDGRFVALVLVKDGKQQIWIRALDPADIMPLAGTDGAADPFWSPDSRFVAFFADSRLKKIERLEGRCKPSAMRWALSAARGIGKA